MPFDLHPQQNSKNGQQKEGEKHENAAHLQPNILLKKDKQSKGNAPLFAKITINGTPGRLSTKRRIAIDHWNQKEQKITTQTEYNNTVQEKIRTLTAEINQAYDELRYSKQRDRNGIKIWITDLITREMNLINVTSSLIKENVVIETRIPIPHKNIPQPISLFYVNKEKIVGYQNALIPNKPLNERLFLFNPRSTKVNYGHSFNSDANGNKNDAQKYDVFGDVKVEA